MKALILIGIDAQHKNNFDNKQAFILLMEIKSFEIDIIYEC
jgi:hypothetical protein